MEKQNEQKKNVVKNSLVLSGLLGTAGLFIAKMLGLVYSIPLSSILGSDTLMSYYGTSYQIYSYILNVFTAGIPFAISTLVAKYTILEDNKALSKIRTMSLNLMKILGVFGMLLLILLSGLIAPIVAGKDSQILQISLCILSLAIFLVPILSAYRGFWQGRKEMVEYAFSQTFEQIFRVGFLLTCAFLIVYVFNMERTYALYVAVLSTSIAAIAAIIQIYIFDRKKFKSIKNAAKKQTKRGERNVVLFKELIVLAIPYLLTATIGYIDAIFNSILLPIGLRMHGYDVAQVDVILSAFNYVGSKLTSIPQILAPGFIAALIPHITEARIENNRKSISKMITESIGIVLFIGSMLSACIAIYAEEIYHILFFTSDIELAANVIRWISIEGFLGTICPVTSSLMIALGLKRDAIRRQLISAIMKGVTMLPLLYFFGFSGAIISSMIGSTYLLISNIIQIDKLYDIYLKYIARDVIKVSIALIAMYVTSIVLTSIGLDGAVGGKFIAFIKLGINSVVAIVVYFGLSNVLHIPQDLFHRDIFGVIKSKLKRS